MRTRTWTATEKEVEHRCDRMMTEMGFAVVRFSQARATMQSPGIPDRKYYRGRITLWFECKRVGGKQSLAQKLFQQQAEAAGEVYVLGGPDSLLAQLRAIGVVT